MTKKYFKLELILVTLRGSLFHKQEIGRALFLVAMFSDWARAGVRCQLKVMHRQLNLISYLSSFDL